MSDHGGNVLAARRILVAAALIAGGAPMAQASPPVPARQQAVLSLTGAAIARAYPAPGARVVARVAMTMPFTGIRSTLPVTETRVAARGGTWLRIRLPARPNGATGWVPATAGIEHRTPWLIEIDRSARRADIREQGRLRARFSVVVGKHDTPTPLGTYFVTEKLHLGADVAEGPWALATSAYSYVLQEFDGGPGQIALHGRTGFPEPLGTFSSHGCVRFSNRAISWIAARVGAGTPIVIER
jgi:lipoprotein-anchoring transpeptidase ErfK/SrfK